MKRSMWWWLLLWLLGVWAVSVPRASGADATVYYSGVGGCDTCTSTQTTSSCIQCTPSTIGAATSVCLGNNHVLQRRSDGSVVGLGPIALLGQGSLQSNTTCSRAIVNDGATAIVLVASGARSVACSGNMSLILLDNGTVLVFGQAPAAGVIASNSTFVSTMMPLERMLFPSTTSPQPLLVAKIGVGVDALVCLLQNGSLLTTGNGSLSAIATIGSTWWRLVTNLPCSMITTHNVDSNNVTLSVGAQHALLTCSNGSVVGFGDNSFGQINSRSDVFLVSQPEILTVPSTALPIASVSAGYSHSLLLSAQIDAVTNTTIAVGAGDNTNGALGVSGGGFAYGFRIIPITFAASRSTSVSNLTSTRVTALIAGRHASMLVLRATTRDMKQWGTNVYVVGKNQQCVLSTATTTGSTVLVWSPLVLDTLKYLQTKSVSMAVQSERSALLADENPTTTQSRSMLSPTSASTMSSSITVDSVSGSPTHSSIPSMTDELETFTTTRTVRRTPSRTTSTTSTIQSGPSLESVLWSSASRRMAVLFDAATDMPSTDAATFLAIHGAMQSFGQADQRVGAWQSSKELWVDFSAASTVNITPFVASMSIRTDGGVLVRRTGGFSLPAVTWTEVIVRPSTDRNPSPLSVGADSLVVRVAIGVGVGVFVVILIIAIICFCRKRRHYIDSQRKIFRDVATPTAQPPTAASPTRSLPDLQRRSFPVVVAPRHSSEPVDVASRSPLHGR